MIVRGLAKRKRSERSGLELAATMIPAGYMFKTVGRRLDWLKAPGVSDVYSVSGCVSKNFTDYTKYWKHNGYWLFDAPAVMEDIAKAENLDLAGMTLFYYEVFPEQFDEETGQWSKFEPEASLPLAVAKPKSVELEGYDVTTFSCGPIPECSPLSCNSLAARVAVNRHCLFDSFERAKEAIDAGTFVNVEPGPFRIFAVYTVVC